MKKKVKTVCQIIRFRGKIEAFLVSIDLFDIPNFYPHIFGHISSILVIKQVLDNIF